MSDSNTIPDYRHDWLDRLVAATLVGGVPKLILVTFLAAGAIALLLTSREEEPQIVVPVIDVHVEAPGLSARQVERQVTTPLEKLLAQIKGVEHIYSVSRFGAAIVTIRFYVGEDRESALFNTYNKVYSNSDAVPDAVASWVVKPVEIDDVPIVMLGLWSDNPQLYDDFQLRRMAEEIAIQMQALPDTNRVSVIGGRARRIQVLLNPAALAAHHTAPLDVVAALRVTNRRFAAGEVFFNNEAILLEAGEFIQDSKALAGKVINVIDGRPVYLKDVASIVDGPAVAETYGWLAFGTAHPGSDQWRDDYPLVTLAVAKQRGANAVWIADEVHALMQELATTLLPPEVHIEVLRDYGATADEKVNDLVSSLVIAIATVVLFIGLFLGWRPALVVAIAIPLCYGAALTVNMISGYTINRVTLFALILALGLLVDDPITGIDNIERYHDRADSSPLDSIVNAIREIRTPLFMSTLTIIVAFVPLAFITGMMGPYMAPMALNVPVTVILSTLIAFLVTPWLAHRLFVSRTGGTGRTAIAIETTRLRYGRLIAPVIANRRNAKWFLGLVAVLFALAVSLPMLRMVPLKLLPFDNKNELQVIIDMPEGTTLEKTRAVVQEAQQAVLRLPEVKAVAAYVGHSSPIDFNGMIRKYYLRTGSHLADLRITLADKSERSHQSHAILLRLRPLLSEIERRYDDCKIKTVEVPPGPPVISTLVAEVYGSTNSSYESLREAAYAVAERLQLQPGVVDVDVMMEKSARRLRFVPDTVKAALSGISSEDIAATIALANRGITATSLQRAEEINPLAVELRLPQALRSNPDQLLALGIRGRSGIMQEKRGQGLETAPQPLVNLAELGAYVHLALDRSIYHKDLMPVVYVTAETAGAQPAEIVADIVADRGSTVEAKALGGSSFLSPGNGLGWDVAEEVEVVWAGEGEWRITLRVFRDMGMAFAFALIAIFFLLPIQTASSSLSIIIMLAIPLTVIGLMPGFWLLNSVGERQVAGFGDPVLFTATAMIGMIALAGIVVRNSLILVEFISTLRSAGARMEDALIEAGATRIRPILLTAGTTLLGNLVITLDPVFSGLAWAVIFGIVSSTAFTLLVIPCVYYLVFGRDHEADEGVAYER
jgi:multidrug efflux pump subunit AcrB|tara:strand:- start:13740 stop:17093 length:3354 start_codon:yes stop_codon:yes gene_type:complete